MGRRNAYKKKKDYSVTPHPPLHTSTVHTVITSHFSIIYYPQNFIYNFWNSNLNMATPKLFLLLLCTLLVISFCEGKKKKDLEKVTTTVFFDVSIDGVESGRIVMGLFGETGSVCC